MAENKEMVIIGVDTHKRFHSVAVITKTGRELACKSFDADGKGYKQALAWASGFGTVLRAGIEGTGSYGAGLCAYLKKYGIEAQDVYAPDKKRRHRQGKDDETDAFQAAQAALSLTRCATAKDRSGDVEAARLLEVAYAQAVKQHTANINALKAALLSLPSPMREQLEALGTTSLVKTCSAFRIAKCTMESTDGVKYALRSLARMILSLETEMALLDKEVERYAKALAPTTVSLLGIGCHGAVKLLCAAGQNIERMKGESSFSMLCGTSPIPASSGDVYHRRLNRGGNRQANNALYVMAITRMRHCERTKTFIAKKMSEGKSKKDAIRALKRYLAREVFSALKADLERLCLAG
jgi:transposase